MSEEEIERLQDEADRALEALSQEQREALGIFDCSLDEVDASADGNPTAA